MVTDSIRFMIFYIEGHSIIYVMVYPPKIHSTIWTTPPIQKDNWWKDCNSSAVTPLHLYKVVFEVFDILTEQFSSTTILKKLFVPRAKSEERGALSVILWKPKKYWRNTVGEWKDSTNRSVWSKTTLITGAWCVNLYKLYWNRRH